jgi:hypothetical protein
MGQLAHTTIQKEPSAMGVSLVEYPAFPTDVIKADQAVLDALAADHIAASTDVAPEMERFLFGDVPLRVFDDIFAGTEPFNAATARWLLHLSGYFGGRWLRGEIAAAQPEAPLIAFSLPPTPEAFDATMARAQEAIDAAAGDAAGAIAYARQSLFDAPPADPEGEPIPGLVDSFGYNAGYNIEILEAPPEGLAPVPEYEVRCTGLLRCEYATPKLAVLAELAEVATALNGDDPTHTKLADSLRPIQEAAFPRGRGVWSTGLSVQGFGQGAYEQLLDVSSSFLETVQATALTMVRASATGAVESARRGALADAAMTVWLAAYMAGLINGEGEIELPSFDRQ